MKPIHFQPKTDAAARHRAATEAYRATEGPGVAAVVRTAPTTEQRPAPQHLRKIQLDDYVERIRQHAKGNCQLSRPDVTFHTSILDENETEQGASTATVSSTISRNQTLPTKQSNITQYRIDTGHSEEGSHRVTAPHVSADEFSPEGHQTEIHRQMDAAYQRQLIDDISLAIASALTDVPDEQLQQKLPKPPQKESLGALELPVEVAAWDVEDFRWPSLSNQMIATASDAMQQLYDNIVSTSHDDGSLPTNRLAVCGAGRGEGTSTIAISLARWAAACGKSILLVDADLANPSLTTQVGLQHGLSWLKAVSRNDDPAEVIIRSQQTSVCVMPLAPITARSDYPRCLFDSLGPFLGKVESFYDWVVIDFGPGSQVLSELSRPELLIDSALLIGTETNSKELSSLQRRLHSLGLERFVLAQNSVSQQEAA